MFGGNSNWRGPVWFPVNYLIVEALQRYHYYYGDDLQIELPTGSGNKVNLKQAAQEIARRLMKLFEADENGARACHKHDARPDIHDGNPLFYEYFHADEGRGVGASHQTGWTSLIARCADLIAQCDYDQ
eukprot:TRINITY_DN4011_c0_g2_i1.p1 TRINITY_DN4011_c0_g2~~TRINITY_DN4011_c0_g2_i1.p1  ORF type:complete len:150 (+),score=50.95 TRINITY_DN4011_c0_g2_i1:66-452(+)